MAKMRLKMMDILSRYKFVIIILILVSISIVSSLPFRFNPTHLIVKQVNCISCHDQEFKDLKLGNHIKTMGLNQNRTLFDYVNLFGNISDPAYKTLVGSCYTCHVAYKRYDLFGLTDPYVYPAGNYAYTVGNIAVSQNVYNAQYGTIIDWPYPDSNITVLQNNGGNEAVTAQLELFSVEPTNSAVTSDMKIQLSNYAGQQTGTIFESTQVLNQGNTQILSTGNINGDYFNISIALSGTWNNATLLLMVNGTDQGTQSFTIDAQNPPISYNIPKDITGGDYLKTNGSYNAVRLDAIWNIWTNWPVNGNIASTDLIQTSTIGGGSINSTSCSAPDGMCHIIQKATSIGLSDGQNPDKTFYSHRMESVTSKQCRVCHLSSTLPPDNGMLSFAPTTPLNPAPVPTQPSGPGPVPTQPSGPGPVPTQPILSIIGPSPSPTPPSINSPIQHVIIVPFENHQLSDWMADPYFASLGNRYGSATNFHGFSGTSLPSYLIETSGSNQGVTGDSFTPCQFKVPNIYDTLTRHGLTYENYEESGNQVNHRHTPGYFYPTTCNNIQDMNVFESKYISGNQIPPNYVWVTANFCDIAHDCGVSTASNWLKNTFKLDTLLSKPWFKDGSTLVILVCDDGGSSSAPTMDIMISYSSLGTTSSVYYTHDNDLSTVMWLLRLPGSIGNADSSKSMKDLFG